MSDIYEQINRIPMIDVLDKLGIEYSKEGSNYVILQDGKLTDGRKVEKIGNYVNDFSHSRPRGGPRAFVKSYLRIPTKEVYIRFKTEFGIGGDYKPPRKKRITKLYKPHINYKQIF